MFLVIWFRCHRGGNHVCSGKGFPSNDGRGSRHTPLPSAAERLAGWGAALFSDSAEIGRGGAGPPLALPLQAGPRERQHTAWPLNTLTAYLLTLGVGVAVEKVVSTNMLYLVLNITTGLNSLGSQRGSCWWQWPCGKSKQIQLIGKISTSMIISRWKL